MDATRCRRLKDDARRSWYSTWRSVRFARHMGMPAPTAAAGAFALLRPQARAAGK